MASPEFHRMRALSTQFSCYAFASNGSCDMAMLASDSIPFKSPESLEVRLSTPNRRAIRSMDVRKAVTLILSGDF